MARERKRRRRRKPRPPKDELPRMLVHVSWGSAFAVAYLIGLPRYWAVWLMAMAFLVLLLLEAMRLTYRRRPPEDPMGFLARTYARLGRRFMRTHERRGEWVAALASVGGYLLALILFDKLIAVAAILSATLGDPVARVVGIRWGSTRLVGRKSLEGAAALALTSFAVCRVLGFAWPVALAGAAGAVLADIASAIDMGPIPLDDNFVGPVVCALALWLASGAA